MPSQEKIFNTRGEADFERPRVGTSEGGRGNFWNQAGGPDPKGHGLMRGNRPSIFSEILQQVVFSYLVVHCKKNFFGKTLVAPPQGPKRGKKP